MGALPWAWGTAEERGGDAGRPAELPPEQRAAGAGVGPRRLSPLLANARLPGFEAEPVKFSWEYWNRRRIFRLAWGALTFAALLAIVVLAWLAAAGRLEIGWSPHFVVFALGTVFTVLAVPISLYGIWQHLDNYSVPEIQLHMVRVLFMVPVYATDSWLALVLGVFCHPEKSLYVDTLREWYEAYTIYSFYRCLIAYVEHEFGCPIAQVCARKPPMRHMFPLYVRVGRWEWEMLAPWEMGEEFVSNVSWGILNYVVVRPVTTFFTLVLEVGNRYGNGELNPALGYPYIMFVNNCSQMWAIYCLVVFYHEMLPELRGMRPLLKFVCVKGVVFATFWQDCLLQLLNHYGVFNFSFSWRCYEDTDTLVAALQDFLICFEMLIFALLHAVAFPSREFRKADLPRRRFWSMAGEAFNVADVRRDVDAFTAPLLERASNSAASIYRLTAASIPFQAGAEQTEEHTAAAAADPSGATAAAATAAERSGGGGGA